MVSAYRKGIRRVSSYYCIAIFASLAFHLAWGWQYITLMPRSTTIFIFSVLIGIAWATLNITRLFCSSTREQNLGELLVHSIIFIAAAVIIIRMRIA